MSGFLSKCVLECADNQDDGRWIVAAPIVYQSDVAACIFIIPAGFQTDLASVPRLPIVFTLCGATSNEAACLHDWLYSAQPVDRAKADAVLREASECTGVPGWRRNLMYWGVRLFGWSHWAPA